MRGFATVQNTVPAELEIGQIFSVVDLFFFFVSPVFERVDGRTAHFSEKHRSKTGTCTGFCRGSRPFSVSGPIRLIRGRWHSPQVAPAAPPAPRVHSSNFTLQEIPVLEQTLSTTTCFEVVDDIIMFCGGDHYWFQ